MIYAWDILYNYLPLLPRPPFFPTIKGTPILVHNRSYRLCKQSTFNTTRLDTTRPRLFTFYHRRSRDLDLSAIRQKPNGANTLVFEDPTRGKLRRGRELLAQEVRSSEAHLQCLVSLCPSLYLCHCSCVCDTVQMSCCFSLTTEFHPNV